MRRFLLVRHAQPAEGPDPGLTELGRAQAAALAGRLRGTEIDVAWSSGLRRAAETAGIVVARHDGLNLQVSPLLREYAAPPSADQPDYAEIERLMLTQFMKDLSAWLASLCAPDDGASDRAILVVSHAGPLRVLTCLLLGLPVEKHWSFRFDWASLSVVERSDDMGTLVLLNDRGHLGPESGGW